MNTQNIINYIKKHLIEFKKNRISLLICLAVIPILSENFSSLYYVFVFIFAGQLLSDLSHQSSRIAFLMTPISTTERTIANGIILYVIFNIVWIAVFCLGTFVHSLLFYCLLPEQTALQWHFPFSYHNIAPLLIIESICMFGCIYFRRNAMVRTAVSLLLIVIALAIIMFITQMTVAQIVTGNIANGAFYNPFQCIPQWAIYIACGIVFIFFNFMSWLRLRETEA